MLKYLALGDSYTIGEGIAIDKNFPHQTVVILKEKYGIDVAPPDIIAVTGWTTDELLQAIEAKKPITDYEIVTLLIGVNNQYRHRDIENYKEEFTQLLLAAISCAKGKSKHVFVLSIPDWGVTPFAVTTEHVNIAEEIDYFNLANKKITQEYNCNYLDITPSTRLHGRDTTYLTDDMLHYSAKEYTVWATALAPLIAKQLS